MKLLLVCLFCIGSIWADVQCLDGVGQANGVWSSTVINGISMKTCSGSNHPVYYRVSRGATLNDMQARQELNQVAEDAWLGDTIMLRAGDVWTLPTEAAWVFTRRLNGSGYLTVTTTEYDKLPNEGTRITPAYIPLLPVLQVKDSNTTAIHVWGSGSVAEHIRFRGLFFRPSPNALYHPRSAAPALVTGGFIHVGSTTVSSGKYDPGKAYMKMETQVREAVAVASATADGSNRTVLVSKATGFTPGKRAQVADQNGPIYTIESINTDGQHSITMTEPLSTPVTVGTAIRNEAGDAMQQPNDIIIQHCVFRNPGSKWQITRFVVLDGRDTTVRDNYFSSPLSSVGSLYDTQVISSVSGPGPLTIENNFIDGGSENVMFGGSYSHTDKDVAGAMIRFNFLSHVPERDMVGSWALTQPTFSPARLAGISVPGLPVLSPRLVFSGRHVRPTNGNRWYRALNTGVVGTVEPNWPTNTGDEVYDHDPDRESFGQTWCNGQMNPGDGVCWATTPSSITRPLIKNNFELKAGDYVTLRHNVVDWYGSMYSINGQQYAIISIKGNPQPIDGTNNWCGQGFGFPYCHRAGVTHFTLDHNIIRGYSGGLLLRGSGSYAARAGNHVVRHNLFLQTEQPLNDYSAYFPLTLFESTDDNMQTTVRLDNVRIENNTFFSPFILPTQGMKLSASANSPGYGGERTFYGNIWARGATAAFSKGDGTRMDGGSVITDVFPGTSTGGVWGNNIVVGASNAPGQWPDGTVWTGCPTPAACITTSSDKTTLANLWAQVFRDPAGGDFSLRDDQPGKRACPDGSDIGADTSQLPEIRDFRVTASAKEALFQWTVTEPIQDIPCVVEVHTAPDFESGNYVAELGQIDTFFRQDADDAPQNTRRGRERMLAIGHSVPLQPATTYYYRLHCGGDVRRGMFSTAEERDTPDQTISRIVSDPAAQSVVVEYGRVYDRSTDTITDAQEAVAICQSGQQCAVSFRPPASGLVYFRWKERNGDGAVVLSSDVWPLVAQ